MTHFFQAIKKYHLAILSGLLIALSYPPFPAWAVFFCLAPLWFLTTRLENLKSLFWAGWWTQFSVSMVGFHWVAITAHDFGFLPWIVSIPVLFIFASFAHLHIPAAVVLVRLFQRGSPWPVHFQFLALALTTGLLERIWPMIFPWHSAYSLLHSQLPMYQLAELIGFSGLSTLLMLTSAGFAWGLSQWSRSKKKSYKIAASVLVVILGLNLWGFLIKPIDKRFDKYLKVLIVQANIGQFEKVLAEKNLKSNQNEIQQAVMDKYFQLTDEAVQKFPEAEVIIWPETALADYLDPEYLSRPRQQQLQYKILSWQKALITGSYSRQFGTNRTYNGMFFFDYRGQLSDSGFRKNQLLAFGERLPFGDTFPWLYDLLPFVSSFSAGPGPQVKKLQTLNQELVVSPQICYESLHPWFARKSVLMGADIIVNVTNDSWFGEHFEPYQHASMTWARAIENRRPLIRSTNTGQSSVIAHTGRILITSPINQEWSGLANVPIPDRKVTVYMRYGHLDWILILVILLGLIGGLNAYGRKTKH